MNLVLTDYIVNRSLIYVMNTWGVCRKQNEQSALLFNARFFSERGQEEADIRAGGKLELSLYRISYRLPTWWQK